MHCAIRAHDADFVPTPQGLPEAMLHAEMRPPSGRLPLQRCLPPDPKYTSAIRC